MLSERRAIAVREFFRDRGIEQTRLTARGYGESDPLADNTTAAGKARNRRVVLRVLSR
jgi:outer membrane protein OmpA-like peptidoglycan-associated protein